MHHRFSKSFGAGSDNTLLLPFQENMPKRKTITIWDPNSNNKWQIYIAKDYLK